MSVVEAVLVSPCVTVDKKLWSADRVRNSPGYTVIKSIVCNSDEVPTSCLFRSRKSFYQFSHFGIEPRTGRSRVGGLEKNQSFSLSFGR